MEGERGREEESGSSSQKFELRDALRSRVYGDEDGATTHKEKWAHLLLGTQKLWQHIGCSTARLHSLRTKPQTDARERRRRREKREKKNQTRVREFARRVKKPPLEGLGGFGQKFFLAHSTPINLKHKLLKDEPQPESQPARAVWLHGASDR